MADGPGASAVPTGEGGARAAVDSGDVIELRGYRLMAIVGVLDEERQRAQPLELDLDVFADLAPAGASDELTDTVDYGGLCAVVESVVSQCQPLLLERLADRIVAAVLGVDDRITAVTLGVRKLRPPVPQDLGTSGVRIHRVRGPQP